MIASTHNSQPDGHRFMFEKVRPTTEETYNEYLVTCETGMSEHGKCIKNVRTVKPPSSSCTQAATVKCKNGKKENVHRLEDERGSREESMEALEESNLLS